MSQIASAVLIQNVLQIHMKVFKIKLVIKNLTHCVVATNTLDGRENRDKVLVVLLLFCL